MADGKIHFDAAFGPYRMTLEPLDAETVQVTVYNVAELRFPLMWSRDMTKKQAEDAKELFENIGFFVFVD